METKSLIGERFKAGRTVLQCVGVKGGRMVLQPVRASIMQYYGLCKLRYVVSQIVKTRRNLLVMGGMACFVLFAVCIAALAIPTENAFMYETVVGPRRSASVEDIANMTMLYEWSDYMHVPSEVQVRTARIVSDSEPEAQYPYPGPEPEQMPGSEPEPEPEPAAEPEPKPEPETRPEPDPVPVSAEPEGEGTEWVAGRSLGYFMAYAYCNCTVCCGSWSPYHRSRMINEQYTEIDEHTSEETVVLVTRFNPDYMHRTASGTVPTVGRTIATDWSILPRGTRVIINGQLYIAEDTGTGIVGRSLDIYFGDWMDGAHQEALKHGVRRVEVFAAVRGS